MKSFEEWLMEAQVVTAQNIIKGPQGIDMYLSPSFKTRIEKINKTNNPNIYYVKTIDKPNPYYVNINPELIQKLQKPQSPQTPSNPLWKDIPDPLKQKLESFPSYPYFWMDLNGNPIKKLTPPPLGFKPEYMDKTSDMAQKLSGSHKIAEYVYMYSLAPQNIKRRVLGWLGDTTNFADEYPIPLITKAIEIPIELSKPGYQKMMAKLQGQMQNQ